MFRRMFHRWLLLLVLPCASIAAAQMQQGSTYPQASPSNNAANEPVMTGCPWLSIGTAAKLLGEDVLSSVNVSNTGMGSCKFSRQGQPSDLLEIVVSKQAPQMCPADSAKITGVGNWAARCAVRARHHESSEMIVAQLRDIYFTVTLTLHTKKLDPQTDDALEQAAEEVAGSLY